MNELRPSKMEGTQLSPIGKPLQRKEDERLLRGGGLFVDDLQLVRQLEMAVLRCPFPHASIRSIDVSGARALPGVVHVLTGEDVRRASEPITVLRPVPGAPQLPYYALALDRALHEGQAVSAFTRPGDQAAQSLARDLGCAWTGGCDDTPPEPLDAAIIFAPDGALVPAALAAVRKGGTVVCGGIHMSDIPSFPYALLWEERRLLSVANLTRQDALDYFPLAAAAGVRAHVRTYPLLQANEALADLRRGAFTGAAVLVP